MIASLIIKLRYVFVDIYSLNDKIKLNQNKRGKQLSSGFKFKNILTVGNLSKKKLKDLFKINQVIAKSTIKFHKLNQHSHPLSITFLYCFLKSWILSLRTNEEGKLLACVSMNVKIMMMMLILLKLTLFK